MQLFFTQPVRELKDHEQKISLKLKNNNSTKTKKCDPFAKSRVIITINLFNTGENFSKTVPYFLTAWFRMF